MRRILIADSSEEFRYALCAELQDQFEISTCDTGKQVLEMLRFFQPDILVIDLMLPYIDGLTVLQMASDTGQLPIVIAVTYLANEYIQELLGKLGVSYLMMKPLNLHAMIARIRDLDQFHHGTKDQRPRAVEPLLLRLGLAPKVSGYRTLVTALEELRSNPGMMITKELYPRVAALCGMRSDQAEHAIRFAIETAWKHGDRELWTQYFPRTIKTGKRPTNGEFLSALSTYMNLRDGE